MARGQNQTVGADVLQFDAGSTLAGEGMIQWRDQHSFEIKNRPVTDILGNLEHGTHSKVRLVGTEHRHAITASYVMQFDSYSGIGVGKMFDRLW